MEGASFLRAKVVCHPAYNEKCPWPLNPPPDLSNERIESKEKPSTLPKWWNKMYSRQAKGIPSATWSNLMKPVDWKEVLQTIKSSDSEKAAGLDGVNSDLVKILTEDSTDKPTPLLQSLVAIINISFQSGSSMVSWRKAIISMISKKKDDGSFTDQIR